MGTPIRKPAFSFAEVAVSAPWAYQLLAQHWDNDKGELLHRNNAGDERSSPVEPVDALVLERRARAARARHLGALVRRLARALTPRRAAARVQPAARG